MEGDWTELTDAISEIGKDLIVDTAVDQITGMAVGTAVGAIGGAFLGGAGAIPGAAGGNRIGQGVGIAVGTVRLLKNGKKLTGYVEKGKKIYKISNKLIKNSKLEKKLEKVDSFAERGYQFLKIEKGVKIDAKAVNKIPTKEVLNNIQKQASKYADDICDWVKEVGESIIRGNKEVLKNGGRADGLQPIGELFKAIENFKMY